MSARLAAMAVLAPLMVLLAAPTLAHRTDEYLQATTILVGRNQVEVRVRLAPGIAVASKVLSTIDTDRNGVLSPSEQRAYALRVVRDLSLSVDGRPRRLRLAAFAFPDVREMKAGNGAILLDFHADLPRATGDRKLAFENRHQRRISAYLVNGLAPSDPDIRMKTQKRNYEQSLYELDYVQSGS